VKRTIHSIFAKLVKTRNKKKKQIRRNYLELVTSVKRERERMLLPLMSKAFIVVCYTRELGADGGCIRKKRNLWSGIFWGYK
jgi:hypothetical protein